MEKKNETLAQQEKARKEFLALKKMQQENAEKGTEHKAYEDEKKPSTFKEKLSHFWYYYKTAVVIGSLIFAAVVYILVQTVMTPKSDMQIVIYDNRIVPDMYLDNAKTYFEQFCKDYNGDGKVVVTIVNCTYSAGQSSAEYQQMIQQKLNGTIVTDKETMLIITSDMGYGYLQNVVDTPLLSENCVELGEDFYDSIEYFENIEMPDGLKIYSRNIKDTLIEDNAKAQESVKRAEEFLSMLTKQDK